MDVIPEGEIIDYKIDIIRKEIELANDEDTNKENNNENKDKDKNNDKDVNNMNKNDNFKRKDVLYFIRTKKINRIIKEENSNYYTINSYLLRSKSKSDKNDFYSNECSENYYSLKKSKNDEIKDEKNINDKNLNNLSHSKINNKGLQIINLSDNYIFSKKKFLKKNSAYKFNNKRKK